MGICLVAVKLHQALICISPPSAGLCLRGRRRSVWVKDPKFTGGAAIRPLGEKYDETEGRRLD
jgi:hypothetical protein